MKFPARDLLGPTEYVPEADEEKDYPHGRLMLGPSTDDYVYRFLTVVWKGGWSHRGKRVWRVLRWERCQ
jgi:hypothetical protein